MNIITIRIVITGLQKIFAESIQGDYISYYVNYYVQVDDSKEEKVKISAVYAPVLENGKKERK